jgi:hypothetical protein
MTTSKFTVSFGPFAEAEESANDFGSGLIFSNAMHECVIQMVQVEQDYQKAVEGCDDDLAQSKMLQLKTLQQSLALSAHIFAEVDEVSA